MTCTVILRNLFIIKHMPNVMVFNMPEPCDNDVVHMETARDSLIRADPDIILMQGCYGRLSSFCESLRSEWKDLSYDVKTQIVCKHGMLCMYSLSFNVWIFENTSCLVGNCNLESLTNFDEYECRGKYLVGIIEQVADKLEDDVHVILGGDFSSNHDVITNIMKSRGFSQVNDAYTADLRMASLSTLSLANITLPGSDIWSTYGTHRLVIPSMNLKWCGIRRGSKFSVPKIRLHVQNMSVYITVSNSFGHKYDYIDLRGETFVLKFYTHACINFTYHIDLQKLSPGVSTGYFNGPLDYRTFMTCQTPPTSECDSVFVSVTRKPTELISIGEFKSAQYVEDTRRFSTPSCLVYDTCVYAYKHKLHVTLWKDGVYEISNSYSAIANTSDDNE